MAARIAALTTIAAAIAVLAGAFAGSPALVVIGGVVSLASGAGMLFGVRRPAAAFPPPQAPQRRQAAALPKEATILLATLRNVNGSERLGGDLHRVLRGIVADERGSIDRAEAHELAASFARSDAAVHAAQRMLSNVDAVSRRLGHDLSIAIGVAETLSGAARVQNAATESVPVLISEASARPLGNQLERVDTIRGEGWQLDVFTFPPAQRRLPGL